ncbi:MAG: YqiJ family protein [Cyanobacteria bacterium]|nr:YqiJ family protein [Cyanobacteria bacterium CG_2015-16_32_12]NCO78516.1 YqiJ family protein [Cyanobacteria bacterium CG_2015-22_32_23]NCQ04860.1 YqiJ family protein [Cyanobacteria bacterium CG_2015-09_32_10]NCQ42487.1 YqiJ family protein [Cyanobacteria bacterium CG_2015-04_32_10]NCS85633.1 YqiJ family protein [Cyanobacteria bacterium CG_2015-02_32_10]
MLFDTANLTYWIFLGIGIFLFMLVILSGGGEDQDLDSDVDFDADVDADIDLESNIESNITPDLANYHDSDLNFLSILSWFGLGKCPLLILLAINFSTWGVSGWFLNVTIGGFLNTIPQGFLGVVIFLASFIFSIFIGKLFSHPIGKIFANFGEETEGDRLIGCNGSVTSRQIPYLIEGRIAQADVVDSAGNLVTIEVCLPEWAKVVPHRGQEILIIDRQKHCFIAIAKDTSDQDKWLNSISKR